MTDVHIRGDDDTIDDPLYIVDGPVNMSDADKEMFRKAAQHYPRYLFRTQPRPTTGNTLQPLGMLGLTQDDLWVTDFHQTSTKSLLDTIWRHATGMRVKSVFTSWTHSLFCAYHIASGGGEWAAATDLYVLDTSTLRDPHIFHMSEQFIRDIVRADDKDGYPWEFLIHGEVSGFQKIDLSACQEFTSMWNPQLQYSSLAGGQAKLLENTRTFALRFGHRSRFVMAVSYLGYVFIRQHHSKLAHSWDLIVNTTFVDTFKRLWDDSDQLEASEFLDLDFASHLIPEIELMHHMYSHIRENIIHWPSTAGAHITLQIPRPEDSSST